MLFLRCYRKLYNAVLRKIDTCSYKKAGRSVKYGNVLLWTALHALSKKAISPSFQSVFCIWLSFCLWHNVSPRFHHCCLSQLSLPTFELWVQAYSVYIAAQLDFTIQYDNVKAPVTPWCNNLSLAGEWPVQIKLPLTGIQYFWKVPGFCSVGHRCLRGAPPCSQATPRFYLTAVEKNWEKGLHHDNMTDWKWWTWFHNDGNMPTQYVASTASDWSLPWCFANSTNFASL